MPMQGSPHPPHTSPFLRAFGVPSLTYPGAERFLESFRKKDLALLVYLRLEGGRAHSRSFLANLLWGDSTEEKARHSLTQALGRIRAVLGEESLETDHDQAEWRGDLPCDAVLLQEMAAGSAPMDPTLEIYTGDFLARFNPGRGARAFEEWADGRRMRYRTLTLEVLDRAGGQAEAEGDWSRALKTGERAIEIDPFWEHGHRRVMRAWHALGERNRALRHYERFVAWLAHELEEEPDGETSALAEEIRSRPDAHLHRRTSTSSGVNQAIPQETESSPRQPDGPEVQEHLVPKPIPGAPQPPSTAPRAGRYTGILATVALAGLLLGWVVGINSSEADLFADVSGIQEPQNGENIQLRGGKATFLAFGGVLYEYPDGATLRACTGGRPGVVRQVAALPLWPHAALPSAREHPWLRGDTPIKSDNGSDSTVHVAVGCVLGAIPSAAVYQVIFGNQDWSRVLVVPASVLRLLPRMTVSGAYPRREAGALVKGSGGEVRWVTYYGGALRVESPRALRSHCRSVGEITYVSDDEFRFYQATAELPPTREPCAP